MNRLEGKITRIEEFGMMHRLDIAVGGVDFSVVTLSLPEALTVGSITVMVFKETEVALSEECPPDISMANTLECRVQSVIAGNCFWEVKLSSSCGKIAALVFSDWGKRHRLDNLPELYALIRATDIALVSP